MKFKIKIDDSGRGDIFLDDKDISMGCYGFKISAGVTKATELELLIRGDVEIEGEADTYIKLPTREKFRVV